MKHTEEEAREKWCPWARYAEKQNGLLRWAAAAAVVRAVWEHPASDDGSVGTAIIGTVIIVAVAFNWTLFLAWVFLKWGAL